MAFTLWHLDAVSGSHPPHLLLGEERKSRFGPSGRLLTRSGQWSPSARRASYKPEAVDTIQTPSIEVDMLRRDFLAALAATIATPQLAAQAQRAGRPYRIGMVEPISAQLNA